MTDETAGGIGGLGEGGHLGGGAATGVGGSCGDAGGHGPCSDPYLDGCLATCEALAERADELGCTPSDCEENCSFRSAACRYEHQDLFGCLADAIPDDEAGCVCGEDGTIDCSSLCTDLRDRRAACRAPIDAACAPIDDGLHEAGCGGYGEDCYYAGDRAVTEGCGDQFFARWACLAEHVDELGCSDDGQPDDEGVCQAETDALHDCEVNGPPSAFDSLAGCELEGAIEVTPSELSPTDGCEAHYACDDDVELRVECDGENDGTGTSLCSCHIGSESRHGGPVDGEGEEACAKAFLNCLAGGVQG